MNQQRKPYEAPRIIRESHLDGDWRAGSKLPLLSRERLAELAKAQSAEGGELAELVRVYTQVCGIAEALVVIERLDTELKSQVQIAELMVDSVLRGARNRFSVLLQWMSANPEIAHTKWHEQPNGLRWAGTFDEASAIVRTQYGPRRGVEAFVVVRLDD